MKKVYQKPDMSVVMLGQMSCLMQTSEVQEVQSGGVFNRFGGSSSNYQGEIRVKGQGGSDDWEDDWDE